MAEVGIDTKCSVTILWQIRGLSWWESHSTAITSSCFSIRSLDDIRVFLLMYPRGENADDKYVRLYLGTCDKALNYTVDCEWCVLGQNQHSLFSTTLIDQNIQQYGLIGSPVSPSQKEMFEKPISMFLSNDTLTVKCRIWKSREEHVSKEHIFIVSQIVIMSEIFQWPLSDLRRLQLGEIKADSAFGALNDESKEIQISFSFTGTSLQDSDVELEVTVPKRPSVSFVKLLSNSRGFPLDDEITFHPFETRRNVTIFSRQELMKNSARPGYHWQFKLTYKYYTNSITNVDFEPSVLSEKIGRNSNVTKVGCQTTERYLDSQKVPAEACVTFDNLKGDLLFLYQEHAFSDFELRSNDVSFPVHKNILSARSPVFRAMFSSDMEECCSDTLDVPDLDTHTLNRLLIFLYTGTVEPLEWEAAAKLYYAADKYDVSALKQICRSTLQTSIDLSNVCDILVLADRHQDQQLTSSVHDFVLSDFDEIMNSEEWESFMEKDPNFAGKTLHQLCKKRSSKK